VEIARLFKAAGADMIDVSSGQTTREAQAGLRPHVPDAVCRPHPQRGRHRHHGGGRHLRGRPRANSIIAAGRADLCAVGRPHLADPAWTLHEAAKLLSRATTWPKQYLSGRDQLVPRPGARRQLAIRA
jgi:anthraniloyl-CoA monooxygenase